MAEDTQLKSKKVLIVEDDSIQQIVLERIINQMGHTVIGSSSKGSQAIESALRIGAVDLILMDINLADDVDGIEAAKEINKHRDVKLIYITSSEDPEDLERANETDYVAYLKKPLLKESLESAFDKAFANASL
ncbi:response regulator [Fodinibius sp.]|uniref:response regulator n=1 Tax=Fodinibius sp. TaxID=1872440 RepID=UPI002ACDE125|nr:response regulator [Fodinibius sp.]MDZ7659828.1 response regulator [Fodinibius sp.]